jgi:hypothetical protein
MDEETQKIIEEQIKTLPDDVREAIISVDFKTKLQEITKRQRLLIDQAAKLEMETTLVMIGLEPLTDYVENLGREMEISIIRAKEVAMDVSENIFKPIRESLRKMNEDVENDEEFDGPNDNQKDRGEKSAPVQSTNQESNLDRDQILNEIENPATISRGTGMMNFSKNAPVKPEEIKTTTIATKPTQDIEIVPGQTVKDIPNTTSTDILKNKMTGVNINTQQIVTAKPETKLPEIEKKTPTKTADPYRELLM